MLSRRGLQHAAAEPGRAAAVSCSAPYRPLGARTPFMIAARTASSPFSRRLHVSTRHVSREVGAAAAW